MTMAVVLTACKDDDDPVVPTSGNAVITVNTGTLYDELNITDLMPKWLDDGTLSIVDTMLMRLLPAPSRREARCTAPCKFLLPGASGNLRREHYHRRLTNSPTMQGAFGRVSPSISPSFGGVGGYKKELHSSATLLLCYQNDDDRV